MPYQKTRTPIGRRRHRISILRPNTTDDGMGGQVLSTTGWQTIGQTWAAVSALDERDREALAALQISARHAYHIDMPYRSGIRPTMRLVWQDKTLEIHTVVDDDGMRKRLIVQCAEIQ